MRHRFCQRLVPVASLQLEKKIRFFFKISNRIHQKKWKFLSKVLDFEFDTSKKQEKFNVHDF